MEVERLRWASPARRPAANGPTCPARAARAARVLARPILAQYAIINLNCSSAGALPRAANTWYSSSHDSLILWSEIKKRLRIICYMASVLLCCGTRSHQHLSYPR